MLFSVNLTKIHLSTARELTLDAASAARGARTSNKPLDRDQVRKLIDSRNEREKLEGLRRVISVGRPSCCSARRTIEAVANGSSGR